MRRDTAEEDILHKEMTGQPAAQTESIAVLQTEIELALQASLHELAHNESLRRLPAIAKTLSDFITGGGHRIRPLFFLLGCRGYGRRLDAAVLQISAAIEFFHSFALIHDDLVDHSPVRRGKPSLHRLLAQHLGVSEETGEELALLAGDIVYSAAIRKILSVPEPANRITQVLEELMRTAIDTGAGACLELNIRQRPPQEIQENIVDCVQILKTSQYTFVCPLTLAAILTDAAPQELQFLSQFGSLTGQAYQMQDDLDDMQAYLRDPTTLRPCEARHLWPFWRACQLADAREQERLTKFVTQTDADSLAAISGILQEKDVFRQGEQRIRSLLQKGKKALEQSAMADPYKRILWQSLLGFFHQKRPAPEATP